MTKYAAYHAWGFGRSRPGAQDELGHLCEELLKDHFFIGSPDDVAEHMLHFNKRVGMNPIVMSMRWPGLDAARSVATMHLIAEETFLRVRHRL